jgi:hypothetical protein
MTTPSSVVDHASFSPIASSESTAVPVDAQPGRLDKDDKSTDTRSGTSITLLANDGISECTVDFDLVTRLSTLVYKAVDGDKDVLRIKLMVPKERLEQVVMWMNLYSDGTVPMMPRKPVRKGAPDKDTFAPDYDRLKPFFASITTNATLNQLINAANYMQATALLNQLCAVVGRQIKKDMDVDAV